MDSALSNVDRGTTLDRDTLLRWIGDSAAEMRRNRDYLVQLDAAIGDGDHGTNMNRGFEAVTRAVSADQGSSPGHLLVLVGRTLVGAVGGASGPLWGSAFRQMGKSLGDSATFDAPALVRALDAGLAAIVDLGAAEPGDKTMVDAFAPALTRLRDAIQGGESLTAAMRSAAEAAEAGMRATVPLQARRGRASYLGERSIGHQDPGATSTAMIIRALARAVEGD
jgi:phosphoenolpyruvate---glycerone phosphotransferase subunit DhaL